MASNETTLNIKCQQALVATKKRNAEKSLKNVIALPYERYWPLIRGEDEVELITLLQRLLVKLRLERNIPRKLLEGKSAEERKKLKKSFKEELEAKEEYKEASKIRSQLLLGVNAVSKGLQKQSVSVCVVSGDADPVVIANHLLHAAAATRVPAIVLNSLKESCHKTMGFSCLGIAIKRDSNDSILVEMVEKVKTFSSRFALPESLRILANCSSVPVEETKLSVRNTKKSTQQGNSLFLLRPSKGQRAFEPQYKAKSQTSDFIPVSGDSVSQTVQKCEPSRQLKPTKSLKRSVYQPLVVRRLQPNPGKKRRKGKKNKKKEE